MNYVIFDDYKWKNFFPITLTRSTADLRVGILKLRQRLNEYFKINKQRIIISDHLEDIYSERFPDWQINKLNNGKTIFLNSRLKVDKDIAKKINELPENTCLTSNDDILAVKMNSKESVVSIDGILSMFENLERIDINKNYCWQYIWELIDCNSEYIEQDFQDFFYDKDNYFETELGITVLNPYNIWIGEGATIKPGVVIDASSGPVIIDEKALIMPNAVIIGPVFIGKNSIIKVGAKIYKGTTIGPVCKIGGEIEKTIIQAYSNKQHDGFLGHSYLGEWINLGAGTNNSDLKNNYKNVKSYFYPLKNKIDTGLQFLGVIIGDHTKIGINSTINTGSVISVGCNIFGNELIKDFIPALSWGKCSNLNEYKLDKFIETAGIVKNRRKLEFSIVEKKLYQSIGKLK